MSTSGSTKSLWRTNRIKAERFNPIFNEGKTIPTRNQYEREIDEETIASIGVTKIRFQTFCISALAVLAILIYCLTAWQRLTNGWTTIWEQSILVSTFLIRDGKPLYYGLSQHPALTTMYGPFTYYLLLPVTIFRRPDWAVLAGGLWVGLIYVLPIPVLLLEAKRIKAISIQDVALVILVFTTLTLYYPSNSFYGVVPAALCVGLGGLAVIAAVTAVRRDSFLLEICAIGLAGVALMTKQVMLPLVAVYPLLTLQIRGWTASLFAALRMVLGVLLIAGVTCLFNNPRAMYLHTIWIPAHQGWNSVECLASGSCPEKDVAVSLPQKARTLVWLGMRLLIDYDYAFLWVALAGVILWKKLNRTAISHIWPFILTALLQVPTSLMNVAKLGGTPTNYLICTYFVFLAAAAFVLDLDPLGSEIASARTGRRMALAFVVLPFVIVFGRFLRDPRVHGLAATNPDKTSYDYLRNTHDVYFPWYPLSTYLATGRNYDFPQAIVDREVAGVKPSDSFIKKGLPSQSSLFAYGSKDELALDPMTSACKPAQTPPSLDGWTVEDCRTRLDGGAQPDSGPLSESHE